MTSVPDEKNPKLEVDKIFWDLKTRFLLTDNYAFDSNTIQKLILAVVEEDEDAL